MRFRLRVQHAFLVVGIGLLAGAVVAYDLTVRRPRTWPQADATVVSSRVVNPKNPNQYTAEIVFRVEEPSAVRDVTIIPSWSTSAYDMARAQVERYPAGARVRVHVNPRNPNDLRYDLDTSWLTLFLPGLLGVLGLVFTAVGLLAERFDRATAARPAQAFQLASGVFLVVGTTVLAIGVFLLQGDIAMLRDWPEVSATVLKSRVVTSTSTGRRRSPSPLYDIEVTFRYAVGGIPYESTTRYGMASSRESSARARAEQYGPETTHMIRFRPGDPNIIRFDLDSLVGVFLLPGGLLAMGVVFLAFGIGMRRSGGARRA
jgi:hypothetical protein